MAFPNAPHDPRRPDEREPGAVVTDPDPDGSARDSETARDDATVEQTAYDDSSLPRRDDETGTDDPDTDVGRTTDDVYRADEETPDDLDRAPADRVEERYDAGQPDEADRVDGNELASPDRDELTDREEAADRDDRTGEPDSFVEPAHEPTPFAAATVGGAVAASAAPAMADTSTRPQYADTEAGPDTGTADLTDEERADLAEERADLAGERAELAEEEPAELKPGDVPAPVAATLWEGDAAQGFRDRWRDVQLRFVDDPMAATGEAQGLVAEVVETLTATLVEQRTDLDGWRSSGNGDTEHLRVAIRRYRDLLDRLLSL